MSRPLAGEFSCLLYLFSGIAAVAAPLGTAFTYQGRLEQNGSPVNGTVNMAFSLWDDPAAGTQVGSVQMVNGVQVTGGLLAVRLNTGGELGAQAFNGQARWLEIAVNGTTLTPRQEVTPAPYALFTASGGGATNWLNDGDNVYLPTGNAGIGTQTPTEMLHLNRPYADTALRLETIRFQQGPPLSAVRPAGTAVTSGAGQAWASPGAARVSDDARATVSLSGVTGGPDFNTSQNLEVSGFGFAIPAQAVVVGISVQIEAGSACTCSDCDQCRVNGTAELLGGAGSVEPRPFGFPGQEAVVTVGGTFEEWGQDWTPAQVNSAAFGVRLAARLDLLETVFCIPGFGCSYTACDCIGNGSAGVDSISVTVYYYDAAVSSTPVNWTIGVPETVSGLQISPTADLSSPAIHINTDGHVGINTTDPMHFHLAVNGFAAKPNGGSWAALSDARLKRDLRPMEDTLDLLLSLHGYEFEYTDDAVATGFCLPGRQIGLLAQEVEQVFPDWVGRTEDGYLHVTEHATTALMVEALRDLRGEKDCQLAERDRQLAEKGEQIRIQQQRIDELEARLARIERLLAGEALPEAAPAR